MYSSRLAPLQLDFLLTAKARIEPKPIVVNSTLSVSELLEILQRIIVSANSLEKKRSLALTGKRYKESQLKKHCLFTFEEPHSSEVSSVFVLVIKGFDLLGVVTEQDLIQLFDSNCSYAEVTLFEVLQPKIASFSNLQIRQFLKTFSLFQHYWIRRLPVIDRRGQVIGTITCEIMRFMVESYIQKLFGKTVMSGQSFNSDCALLKIEENINSELLGSQALDIDSLISRQIKQPRNQSNEVRLLEERLAQKTAEYQHIYRQLQGQIDQNLRLTRQVDSYKNFERSLANVAQWPMPSLSLKSFFNDTVKHIQSLFQCDRVCIYQYDGSWNGMVIAEAVKSEYSSILNFLIHHDLVSSQLWLDRYQQGEVCNIEKFVCEETDSSNTQLDEETQALLTFFEIKSELIIPVQSNNTLWGLLVVHQCSKSRCWQPFEVNLLQIVASSLRAAIEQSSLSEKNQYLHEELNLREKAHIHRLQQALDFEAMLNRITDRVRDSLDEQQILQTAIQELATVLGVRCCQVVLCNLPLQTVCELSHHYSTDPTVSIDEGKIITAFEELSQQVQQGHYCQFCLTEPFLNHGKNSILVCPVFDDQGYLGDMRLYASRSYVFNEKEIGLVQQVASHCAIAIRQARLYQASQAQVQELEHLHQLKDDFLSTVSHELRTPLSSIKMVTNLLKMTLNQAHQISDQTFSDALTAKISNYLKVLEEECDREINLVNDLLATQNLNTGIHSLSLTTIHLKEWVQPIVESFQHRARLQQQRFELLIANNLSSVVSDSFILSRILVELLNNACKYTPSGECIALELALQDSRFQIRVKNSGVEIPPEALPRIFDPFYRIPKDDRWKTSGTGLGLSLIKRLVEHLGGRIWVESASDTVQFFVELPLSSSTT